MEIPTIFLDRILTEAVKKGASNLHLIVGSVPTMRIGGSLNPADNEEVISTEYIKKLIFSFLSEEELKRFEREKEIVVVKTFANDHRFRVNLFHQRSQPSISFTYIPRIIRSLDDLNLPEELERLVNLDSGLLIVTGPNDSGKTSTIAAFLEEVNKKKNKYIATLEDPVEYLFNNKRSIIEQRQIGRDVDSYSFGLEHCLNEDVDLVYIDDMRNEFKDAIPLVLELASGNSLVILEIKAENSIRALEKILSSEGKRISPEAARYSLADTLVGVISQRLIPRKGGGMALALEVLTTNSAVKSLIREGKIYQIENIIQTSREEGMISMRKSVERLIRTGIVDQEKVDKLKLV